MSAPRTGYATSLRRSLVILAASLFFCYSFAQMLMVSSLYSEAWGKTLGITDAQAFQGHFMQWFRYGNLLMIFPAGILLNSYGPRKVGLVTLGLVALTPWVLYIAPAPWMVHGIRFVTGSMHAFPFLCCALLVSQWFPAGRQSSAMGVAVMLGLSGATLVQTPLLQVVKAWGTTGALLLDGTLGLFLWLFFAAIVADTPTGARIVAQQEHLPLGVRLRRIAAKPQNWLVGLFIGMLNMPLMVLPTWGGSLFEVVYGVTDGQCVADALTYLTLGATVGAGTMGALADRSGKPRELMWGGGIASLLLVLCILYGEHLVAFDTSAHIAYYTLAMLFFTLGFLCMVQVLGYAVVAQCNDGPLLDEALALVASLVMGICPILVEELYNLAGGGTATSRYPLLVLPLAMAVGLGALLFMRSKRDATAR